MKIRPSILPPNRPSYRVVNGLRSEGTPPAPGMATAQSTIGRVSIERDLAVLSVISHNSGLEKHYDATLS